MSSWEDRLGRKIGVDERGSVESLNDVTVEQIAEAGHLLESSRLDAAHYLQTIVRHRELDHVADFLAEVVKGGADARTWRISDMICVVDVSLPWLTELSVERVRSTLEQVDGRRWYRTVPLLETWNDFPFCGAPGVHVERAPYWWTSPTSTNHTEVQAQGLEPLGDLRIPLRRWIASRIAWELRDAPLPSSMEDVIATLRASAPSDDARAAIAGLINEREYADNNLAPGFRGPDELFE